MITEEAKVKARVADEAEKIADLKKAIERGVSAERLSVNSDWMKIKADVEIEIAKHEANKVDLYDSIINESVTTDAKLMAIDRIRIINQQMYDLRFVVGIPAARMKVGEEASEELAKLEEAKS